MDDLRFNIKNRKILLTSLCFILVCVFTLTIAYSALSVVLTIQGSAEITASTWDIHLENPVVKNGSATTGIPTITSGRTLTFNTTLDMPGDFYEFTVDVVNDGSIDAMIDKVTKNPELTNEQAKYLKYEVSYANGESINTKQTIASGVTMPIKVRIEYRKDLNNDDLPNSQVVLNLSLILDYVQSDGNGTSVKDNGVYKIVSASDDIGKFGTIVTIGSEKFYTIGTEDNNIKMLSMHNLYVGGDYDTSSGIWSEYGSEATGMQDETMLGSIDDQTVYKGTIPFSTSEFHGTNYGDYTGSLVEIYVNNYKNLLEELGVEIVDARLLSKEEVSDSETFACVTGAWRCSTTYPWLYTSSFWVDYSYGTSMALGIYTSKSFATMNTASFRGFGLRPVIVISKDYFN